MPEDQALARLPGHSSEAHHLSKIFVLQQESVSAAQQHACGTILPVFGVPFRNIAIDPQALFDRENKKYSVIDLGIGVRTAHIAAAFLERNFLVNVWSLRVGYRVSKTIKAILRRARSALAAQLFW